METKRAILGSAAIAAAGTAVASHQSSKAAKNAANTQAAAADRATEEQRAQYAQMQENLQPYMQAGLGGLTGLSQMPAFSFSGADLQNTPGYQFALQQGLKSLNNQNSAQGMNLSGAQQKGLLQYATGLADQTFGDQYARALQTYQTNYNRLSNLASLGQNAAAGVGNAGMQLGANVGNLMTGAANARAAGMVGSANAISSGIGSIGNNAMMYAMLGNNNAPGYAGGTPPSGGIYGSGNNSFDSIGDYAGYA